jgi:hypothetical protein
MMESGFIVITKQSQSGKELLQHTIFVDPQLCLSYFTAPVHMSVVYFIERWNASSWRVYAAARAILSRSQADPVLFLLTKQT